MRQYAKFILAVLLISACSGNSIPSSATSEAPPACVADMPYPVTRDSGDADSFPKVVLRKTVYEGYRHVITEGTVKNFGAKGDGKTDDTAAFQASLDYVNGKGGGTVFVPAGKYVINGGLTVHRSCCLIGEWYNPELNGGKMQEGSILLAHGGKGNAEAKALLSVANGAAVIGVTVYYPEQNAHSPVAFPPAFQAIDAQGGSGYPTIKYATLVNPWTGLNFGPNWNELSVVEYVYMSPLNVGVFCNMVTDIGRIENRVVPRNTVIM